MEDETLACIKKDEIKYLHSGQISKHIFPVNRTEAHKKGIPHLIVRIFIIKKNQKDQIEYLVQKRGKNKKTYPGYYTDSASGHVVYEKNLDLSKIKQNAYRELEEEFGLKSTDLIKLNFYDFKSEKDKLSREVAYIFVGVAKAEVKLEPNEEELDINESRFYSPSGLQKIFEEKELVDYSEEIWKELLESDLNSLFEAKKNHQERSNGDIALFVGRFQPLHHGHIHVIYRIFEDYNFLKIAIGSSQISHTKDNPFTKEERKQFLKVALKQRAISEDKYNIYYVPDIFNAKKWVDHLVSIVGNFDIVYSNSDWVRELFKNEGYELSKKITIFKNKYSGTHIRKLITKNNKNYRLLIPNEVLEKIKEFDGIERIQELYRNNEKND
ncbi:MAG: nicotinamide-nucleotide adenylyltransferase [Candidatus Lokiarchaeota archaeon]|nr:nicotinamide-nucleotide adenylyltransferase [Candidatus Lokiarchaeota archaeon]